MKTFNQLREGLWANIHAKRKRGEKMRKKGEKGAPTADAMAKAKAGSKNGSTSMENTVMSVRKQNMSKVKPMLSKLARARGVPLKFEPDGINITFKGREKDVQKLMKDIEKDKKLMKLMEGKGTDAALQKKADASGISKSILKKVYDRGLAAWKVGHKPGTTPQQWAMARVNSFITKGKVWHKYDSDLRKQHQGK